MLFRRGIHLRPYGARFEIVSDLRLRSYKGVLTNCHMIFCLVYSNIAMIIFFPKDGSIHGDKQQIYFLQRLLGLSIQFTILVDDVVKLNLPNVHLIHR